MAKNGVEEHSTARNVVIHEKDFFVNSDSKKSPKILPINVNRAWWKDDFFCLSVWILDATVIGRFITENYHGSLIFYCLSAPPCPDASFFFVFVVGVFFLLWEFPFFMLVLFSFFFKKIAEEKMDLLNKLKSVGQFRFLVEKLSDFVLSIIYVGHFSIFRC